MFIQYVNESIDYKCLSSLGGGGVVVNEERTFNSIIESISGVDVTLYHILNESEDDSEESDKQQKESIAKKFKLILDKLLGQLNKLFENIKNVLSRLSAKIKPKLIALKRKKFKDDDDNDDIDPKNIDASDKKGIIENPKYILDYKKMQQVWDKYNNLEQIDGFEKYFMKSQIPHMIPNPLGNKPQSVAQFDELLLKFVSKRNRIVNSTGNVADVFRSSKKRDIITDAMAYSIPENLVDIARSDYTKIYNRLKQELEYNKQEVKKFKSGEYDEKIKESIKDAKKNKKGLMDDMDDIGGDKEANKTMGIVGKAIMKLSGKQINKYFIAVMTSGVNNVAALIKYTHKLYQGRISAINYLMDQINRIYDLNEAE